MLHNCGQREVEADRGQQKILDWVSRLEGRSAPAQQCLSVLWGVPHSGTSDLGPPHSSGDFLFVKRLELIIINYTVNG